MRKPRPLISVFVFAACGIWLIGLGLYFVFLRPRCPEDLRYMGTSAGEIQSSIPGLQRWVHRVFTVMGGFITGTGVLTILAAMNAVLLTLALIIGWKVMHRQPDARFA